MIKTFRCKETELIWTGRLSRKLPQSIQQVVRRKLRMLNNAQTIDDLRIPPANRLEVLKGDRCGQLSIRVNDQFRLCFNWFDGQASDVEVVDYH